MDKFKKLGVKILKKIVNNIKEYAIFNMIFLIVILLYVIYNSAN